MTLCLVCEHPMHDHSLDLEECNAQVTSGYGPNMQWRKCDCQGWVGVPAVHPDQLVLGGEAGGA